MKPWVTLATATTTSGGGLKLLEHDGEFVIRAEGYDLMISSAHDSEDAMMGLACPHPHTGDRVLVGGLGMGYTLRGALTLLPADASVTVVELVPEVIEWNRGVLGPLASHPLDDSRIDLICGDVCDGWQEHLNPISPCGACTEWLKKIAEVTWSLVANPRAGVPRPPVSQI